jgi:ketosteroid isomerase-like protein
MSYGPGGMLASDFAGFIEQYHRGVAALIRSDTEPLKRLWSRRDDVTLANPLGPPARGWHQVEDALDRAAAQVRDGDVTGSERISEVTTADLAYIVEIEQSRLKAGGGDEFASVSLRATTIFRREDGEWRVVHRHADSITAPRSIESVLVR